MRIYRDLAQWYPLITDAGDYAEEAAHIWRLIEATSDDPARTLLELGSGAGHMASHLKTRIQCTLTDISPEMIGLSRALNPECEHLQGDMRTLDLKRIFDVVLTHDAIGYMTSEEDLRAAIKTASAHLRPGGIAIFLPDDVKDTFSATTECGGHDAPGGRGLRYLEWSYDPDEADTLIVIEFALMIREPGQPVRVEHDTHAAGLFDRATWRRLMETAGLETLDVDAQDPHAGEHEVFVARRRKQ
ncbi:MAG: class I SAM-dependent methyltransferase [Methyloligellaceae bacterium]